MNYWGLFALALVLIICVAAVSGCTTEPKRYLTPEADRRMQELCAERGCVVIPVPARSDSKTAEV